MQSFEYLSVRYWPKEINGTGYGFGPRSHHHLDHTLPGFKKRGQLLQSKRTEGTCIAARPSLHSPCGRRDHWGCPASRRRDTPPPRHAAASRRTGRKLAKCRAPKAS